MLAGLGSGPGRCEGWDRPWMRLHQESRGAQIRGQMGGTLVVREGRLPGGAGNLEGLESQGCGSQTGGGEESLRPDSLHPYPESSLLADQCLLIHFSGTFPAVFQLCPFFPSLGSSLLPVEGILPAALQPRCGAPAEIRAGVPRVPAGDAAPCPAVAANPGLDAGKGAE